MPYSGTGVAECAAAGSRQLTQPAAGARCILYAHEAPKCLRMDGKQVRRRGALLAGACSTRALLDAPERALARPCRPAAQEPGPCRFNALGCLFEEAVRMRLDVPPLCRVQAMAEAVAAAAAAWRPPPARLQGGLPPPRLATTQRRQQREREEQQTQPPQAEAIEQKQQEQRAQQQERRPLGAPGSWGPPAPSAAPGWQPAAAAFRPDGCPSPVTGAAGLVGWAQATGIRRIVMVGDSTMRQVRALGGEGLGQGDHSRACPRAFCSAGKLQAPWAQGSPAQGSARHRRRPGNGVPAMLRPPPPRRPPTHPAPRPA